MDRREKVTRARPGDPRPAVQTVAPWYTTAHVASRDVESFSDLGFGESSQYGAHLDRGWALYDRGDLESARASVTQAQELRPEDPDAVMLQGAIAVAEGNPEEGLRCYERAIELDPEFLDPYLTAAQVCLFDLEDPASALKLCTDAADLEHISAFERIDLQLLAIECELLRGDSRQARQRFLESDLGALAAALRFVASHEGIDSEEESAGEDNARTAAFEFLTLDPDGDPLEDEERHDRIERLLHMALRVARLRLDFGDLEGALEWTRGLATIFPNESDVWYLVGEAEHRVGDPASAALSALRTLQLDAELDLPPWLPNPSSLHEEVKQILKSVDDVAFRALLEREVPLPILVQEQPSPELLAEGVDPRVAALALSMRHGETDPQSTLTALAVYVRNLVRFCPDDAVFRNELRLCVLDELAMFFGLDDARREAIGIPSIERHPAPAPAAPKKNAAVPHPDGDDVGKRRATRRRARSSKPH